MAQWCPAFQRAHICALLLLVSLAGCATGSTSSFTQAPLFFSESADESGDIVATSEGPERNATLAQVGGFDADIPDYVAFGGNSVLPVNALLPASAQAALGPAGAQATIAAGGLEAGATVGVQSPSVAVELSTPVGTNGMTVDSGLAVDALPLASSPLAGIPVANGLGASNSTLGPSAGIPLTTPKGAIAPISTTVATMASVFGPSAQAGLPATSAVNALLNATSVANKCLLTKC